MKLRLFTLMIFLTPPLVLAEPKPGKAPHVVEDGDICAQTWSGPWDTKKVRFKNLNCHGQRFGAYTGYQQYNTGRLPADSIGLLGLNMRANAHLICNRFGFFNLDIYQTTATFNGSRDSMVLYNDGQSGWVPTNNEYRGIYRGSPHPTEFYIDFQGGIFTELTCITE